MEYPNGSSLLMFTRCPNSLLPPPQCGSTPRMVTPFSLTTALNNCLNEKTKANLKGYTCYAFVCNILERIRLWTDGEWWSGVGGVGLHVTLKKILRRSLVLMGDSESSMWLWLCKSTCRMKLNRRKNKHGSRHSAWWLRCQLRCLWPPWKYLGSLQAVAPSSSCLPAQTLGGSGSSNLVPAAHVGGIVSASDLRYLES